jgi:hypothetical protein
MKRSLILLGVVLSCQKPVPVGPKPVVESPAPAAVDGVACVGAISPAPDGLKEVTDEALLQSALAASGKGQLCTGRVYEATKPVIVYRVWNQEKSYTQTGRWWSFDVPKGDVESYRKENAICPEWSALNVVSSCTIKVGTHVVFGPGQSATCEGGLTYEKSAVNQVYIPNDGLKGQIFVENCTEGKPWPAANSQ